MSDYLLQHGTRHTPQRERARPDQVPNSEGGYVWAVDGWTRLRRFLILGSEGGTFYARERDLTTENVQALRECIIADGPRVVAEIVEVSDGGRAPKNDPALFALAACISLGDPVTRSRAAEALPRVARIGTHLYHFVAYAETMRGWGRTMRWAVKNWYAEKGDAFAYDAIKYRQRDGWSHRDLLRLSHPKTDQPNLASLFDWVAHYPDVGLTGADLVAAFERAQQAISPAATAALVREFRLPREALRTDHLTDPAVWEALLDVGMPTTALIRNLGNMTRLGVLTSTSAATATVTAALTDAEQLSRARVHPLSLLLALATYASGHGFRSGKGWLPVPQVADALDAAFYLAFGNVEPTGKRILLALDVSGSMGASFVAGTPLSARACGAALALVTAAAEPRYEIATFSSSSTSWRKPGRSVHGVGLPDGMEPFALSPRQRLDDVVKATARLRMGGTDCSIPMRYAADTGRDFDAFVIYTDSETWAGDVQPFQALRDYRAGFVADATLTVVGMTSNGFTIADPNDAGMLDVVGMDAATPAVISEFVAGGL